MEKDLKLTQMTEAQSRTIPLLLDKKDALVKSQTGSGKTLAYAIPIVEVFLYKYKLIPQLLCFNNLSFYRNCNPFLLKLTVHLEYSLSLSSLQEN